MSIVKMKRLRFFGMASDCEDGRVSRHAGAAEALFPYK